MVIGSNAERHEASGGDDVGDGDLAEEATGIIGMAKSGVGVEDLAGDRLAVGVEAFDDGSAMDLSEFL